MSCPISHHLMSVSISQEFKSVKDTLASFTRFHSVLHCEIAVFAMKLPNSFIAKLSENELATLRKTFFRSVSSSFSNSFTMKLLGSVVAKNVISQYKTLRKVIKLVKVYFKFKHSGNEN